MTEEKTIPSLSVEDIVKGIRARSNAYSYGIWVPSLGKEVRFTELDTGQQKRIVKSIVDSPVYNAEFAYTMRDLLKENCTDPEVDVEQLTLIDQLFISLGLRIGSIGPTVDLSLTASDDTQHVVAIQLPDIYEEAKKKLSVIGPETFEIKDIKVFCKVPTIARDCKIHQELITDSYHPGMTSLENVAELRNMIGDMFVNELIKYVDGVHVRLEEGGEYIDTKWADLNSKDQLPIFETFSAKLLKEILDYANKVRIESDKIQLFTFDYNGETYEERLTIDSSFFTVS